MKTAGIADYKSAFYALWTFRRFLLALVLVFFVPAYAQGGTEFLEISAIEPSQESLHEVKAAPVRLGIALPSSRENRWVLDLKAMQQVADNKNVDILVRFAGNDQQYQNLQIQEMLNLGIDALIIAPEDGVLAAEGVEIARRKGVPVIAYDRLVMNCELDAYVTFDQVNVGQLQGEFLANRLPRGGYILIYGPETDSNAALFREGAMQYLKKLIASGDIIVLSEGVADLWKASAAKDIVLAALERGQKVEAVLAPNDDTAGGVIEALTQYNLQGKVLVTGQDATPEAIKRISAGTQNMTVYKNTSVLADTAVTIALSLLEKNFPETGITSDNDSGYPVPTHKVPVTLIDKTTLYWLLRQTEFEK